MSHPVCSLAHDPRAPGRVTISDGEQRGTAVLTADPCSLVFSEAIKVNQLVVLKEYLVNQVATQKCACVRGSAAMCFASSVSTVPPTARPAHGLPRVPVSQAVRGDEDGGRWRR